MPGEVDADRGEAAEIELLQVGRARLQDHLILVIMLEPVGVLAVAAVGRAAAGLDEGGVPRLGPERAQRRRGVEGARAHLHVVGLEDQAALLAPIIVERQDQLLEGGRLDAKVSPSRVQQEGSPRFGAWGKMGQESGIRSGQVTFVNSSVGIGRRWPDVFVTGLGAAARGGAQSASSPGRRSTAPVSPRDRRSGCSPTRTHASICSARSTCCAGPGAAMRWSAARARGADRASSRGQTVARDRGRPKHDPIARASSPCRAGAS